MEYRDGPHDASKFLQQSKRPKALTEDEKMKQIRVKVVDPKELRRLCACGVRDNCWSCKPAHPWGGPWALDKEQKHLFSVDYKRIVPRAPRADVHSGATPCSEDVRE
jgi:hypothetical protein